MSGSPYTTPLALPLTKMITEETLDKYFKPEHPWVRGLFAEDIVGLGVKLDDATSRRLAKLTGWKPKNDKGHRYHNALVMMNITPEDVMYHHMYGFVKGWGDKLDSLKRCGITGDEKDKCLEHFNLFQQFRCQSSKDLNVDDILAIAILVCSFSPHPWFNVNVHQTEVSKQGRRDYARATIEKAKALLEEDAYSIEQEFSAGLNEIIQTEEARAAAKRVTQKRMEQQKNTTKTAREDREESLPPRSVSRTEISTQQRGSSPMSLSTDPVSYPSGRKSKISRSAQSTPAMNTRTRESHKTIRYDSPINKSTDAVSYPSGSKNHEASYSAPSTPAMNTRSAQSHKTTRPYSPMSLSAHAGSIPSGSKTHAVSRSGSNSQAMTPTSTRSHNTSRPGSQMSWTADTGSFPSGRKTTRASSGHSNTRSMTSEIREDLEPTQPVRSPEEYDIMNYLNSERQEPSAARDLARMERRAATSTAHISAEDSPLAYKGKGRAVSTADEVIRNEGRLPWSAQCSPSHVQARQALWKNRDRAMTKPRAATADFVPETDQEEIETESGDESEEENQSQEKGGRKQKGRANIVTLSPTKRSKESPPAHPPSPTKKSRVSSKLTDRSVSPMDKVIAIEDDEIQERQPGDTPPGGGTSDEDPTVPRPDI